MSCIFDVPGSPYSLLGNLSLILHGLTGTLLSLKILPRTYRESLMERVWRAARLERDTIMVDISTI
jgi:hypothetical protein